MREDGIRGTHPIDPPTGDAHAAGGIEVRAGRDEVPVQK